MAMNNDPAGNTKSTPRTESQIAENSRSQYDIDGLLIANSIIPVLVTKVPIPEISGKYIERKKEKKNERFSIYDGPTSQTSGIYATINPIKALHIRPETNMGRTRTTFCMGVYCL